MHLSGKEIDAISETLPTRGSLTVEFNETLRALPDVDLAFGLADALQKQKNKAA